jgi:hypothetical protein
MSVILHVLQVEDSESGTSLIARAPEGAGYGVRTSVAFWKSREGASILPRFLGPRPAECQILFARLCQ